MNKKIFLHICNIIDTQPINEPSIDRDIIQEILNNYEFNIEDLSYICALNSRYRYRYYNNRGWNRANTRPIPKYLKDFLKSQKLFSNITKYYNKSMYALLCRKMGDYYYHINNETPEESLERIDKEVIRLKAKYGFN